MEILNRTTQTHNETPSQVLAREDILMLRRLVRDVPIAPHIQEHAAKLVLGTHPDSEWATDEVRKYVRYGASPRGAQALDFGGQSARAYWKRAFMWRRKTSNLSRVRPCAIA